MADENLNTQPTDEEVLALEVQMQFDNINKQLKNLQRKVDNSFTQISKSRKVSRAGTAVSDTFKKAEHDTDDYLEAITRKINQETTKAESVVRKSALEMRTELENAFDNINLNLNTKLTGNNGLGNALNTISGVESKLKGLGSTLGNTLGSATGGILGGLLNAGATMQAVSGLEKMQGAVGGTLTATQKLNETFKNVEKILGTLQGQFEAILKILEGMEKVQLSTSLQNYARFIHTAKNQVENLDKLTKKLQKRFYNLKREWAETNGTSLDNLYTPSSKKDLEDYAHMMNYVNEKMKDDGSLRAYIHRLEILRNTIDNIKKLAKSGVFDGIDQGSLASYIYDMENSLKHAEEVLSKGLIPRTDANDPFAHIREGTAALDKEIQELSKRPIMSEDQVNSASKTVEQIRQQVEDALRSTDIRFGSDLFATDDINRQINEALNNLASHINNLDTSGLSDKIHEAIDEGFDVNGIDIQLPLQDIESSLLDSIGKIKDEMANIKWTEGSESLTPELKKLEDALKRLYAIMTQLEGVKLSPEAFADFTEETKQVEKYIRELEQLGEKRAKLNKGEMFHLDEMYNFPDFRVAMNDLGSQIGGMIDQVENKVGSVVGNMREKIKDLIPTIKEVAYGIAGFYTISPETVDAGVAKVRAKMSDFWDWVKNKARSTMFISPEAMQSAINQIDELKRQWDDQVLELKINRDSDLDKVTKEYQDAIADINQRIEDLKAEFNDDKLNLNILKQEEIQEAQAEFDKAYEEIQRKLNSPLTMHLEPGDYEKVVEGLNKETEELKQKLQNTLRDIEESYDKSFAEIEHDYNYVMDQLNARAEEARATQGKVANAIYEQYNQAFAKVSQAYERATASLRANTEGMTLFGSIVTKTQEVCGRVLSTITSTVKAAGPKIKELWANFENNTVIGHVEHRFRTFIENVLSVATRGFKRLTSGFSGVFTRIKEHFAKGQKAAKDFGDEVDKTSKKGGGGFKGLLSSIKGMLGPLLSVYAIIKAIKAAISLGIESIQMEGQISNMYRTMGYYIDENTGEVVYNGDAYLDWAENVAKAYGISKKAALEYGNTFSMLVNKFAGQDTAQYTEDLMKQAALIAQGTGRTMDDVMDRIRSGMLGSTEAIEDLGVYVSESTMKSLLKNQAFIEEYGDTIKEKLGKSVQDLSKNYANLNDNEKQALRYYGIMYQSVKAFGRANEESLNTTSGLYLKFQANLENLKTAIGDAFKPLITIVLPLLNTVLEKLTEIAKRVGEVFTELATMMGYQVTDFTANVGYNSDIKDGVEEDTEAMDKLKTNLAGIDEITKITSKSDASTSDVSLTDDLAELPETNAELKESESWLDKISAKLAKIREAIDGIFDKFKMGLDVSDFLSKLESIKAALGSIWDSIVKIFNEVSGSGGKFILDTINLISYTLGALLSMLTSGVSSALNMIKIWLEQDGEYISQKLNSIFTVGSEVIEGLEETIGFVKDLVNHIFDNEDFQNIGADLLGIFNDAFLNVIELVTKLMRDIIDLIIQPFIDNKDELEEAVDGFLSPIQTITASIRDTLRSMWDDIQAMYDEKIKPMFEDLTEGLSSLFNHILDGWNTYINPVLENLAEKFDALMEKVKPALSEIIKFIGNICEVLGLLWKNFIVPIFNFIVDVLYPIIAPIIEAIGAIVMDVVGAIVDAIKGLFEILNGILDFLLGVFTGDLKRACDGIVGIFKGAWDIIWGILSGLAKGVWDAFKGVCDAVVGVFKGLINAVKNLLGIHSPSTVFSDIGVNMIKGLWEGIKSVKDWIWSKISGFFGGILDDIKDFFGIKSPSKVFAWIGEMDMKGLGVGVEDEENSVLKAFTSVFNSVMDTVDRVTDSVGDAMSDIFGGVFDSTKGIKTLLSSIKGVDVQSNISVTDQTRGLNVRRAYSGAGSQGISGLGINNSTDWLKSLAENVANMTGVSINRNSNNMSSEQPLDIHMYVGQTEFGQVSVNSINALKKKNGVDTLDVGGIQIKR